MAECGAMALPYEFREEGFLRSIWSGCTRKSIGRTSDRDPEEGDPRRINLEISADATGFSRYPEICAIFALWTNLAALDQYPFQFFAVHRAVDERV
jgi:hypothetical protein